MVDGFSFGWRSEGMKSVVGMLGDQSVSQSVRVGVGDYEIQRCEDCSIGICSYMYKVID